MSFMHALREGQLTKRQAKGNKILPFCLFDGAE